MEDKHPTNQRRDFIKNSLVAAGIMLCTSGISTLLQSCDVPFNASPEGTASLDVGTVPELSINGGVTEKIFDGQFENIPIIIIRESSTSYLAFSSVCTHYGRKVTPPKKAGSDIICPAHKARFSSVDGRVLSGPAKIGLTKYETIIDIENNLLTISKKT